MDKVGNILGFSFFFFLFFFLFFTFFFFLFFFLFIPFNFLMVSMFALFWSISDDSIDFSFLRSWWFGICIVSFSNFTFSLSWYIYIYIYILLLSYIFYPGISLLSVHISFVLAYAFCLIYIYIYIYISANLNLYISPELFILIYPPQFLPIQFCLLISILFACFSCFISIFLAMLSFRL